jgi:DNA topoisomerase-1
MTPTLHDINAPLVFPKPPWPTPDELARAGDDEDDSLALNCGTGAGGFKVGNTCAAELVGASRKNKTIVVGGEPAPPHIQKLRIPPAWTDLEISLDPNADLLAKGRDAKGRVQAVYSDSHVMRQAAAKFARVRELAEKDAAIAKQIERDMESSDPATREAAAVMSLIRATGIRPGSERDTGGARKAYGATTLKPSHVQYGKAGQMYLRFVGKKGVDLSIQVDDPKVVAMLKARAAAGKAKLFDTTDANLRAYADTLDGGRFSPKDFRTLRGTRTAIEEVAKRKRPPKTQKDYKRFVRDVADVVSRKLGNTPTIALQSYIDPTVFARWRKVAA